MPLLYSQHSRRHRLSLCVCVLDMDDHPLAFYFLNHTLTHTHPSFLVTVRALNTFRKETDDGEELKIHEFEVAALMNLMTTDSIVEEAISLVPSMSRFPEAAIDELLDLIRSTMIRIVS